MYSPEKCKVKKKRPQEKRTCGKNTKHNKLKKAFKSVKLITGKPEINFGGL